MSELNVRQSTPLTRVVLFASQILVKESLQALIESKQDARVIASTTNSAALPELVRRNKPNVVLLCLTNNDIKSVEIISELHKTRGAPVLVVAGSDDVFNQKRAIELGVAGIIQQEKEAKSLLQAIRQICEGETWLEPKLIAQLLEQKTVSKNVKSEQQHQQIVPNIDAITKREREIVSMVGKGLKNNDIADKLKISKATVRHHLSSVYEKLGIADKLNLIIFAYRHNLVKFHDEKK